MKVFAYFMGGLLLAGSLLALTMDSAAAWRTSQSADAYCSDANHAVVGWSFTNTEPNRPSLSMDVVAEDKDSGVMSDKVSVAPGETATGVLSPGPQSIGDGTILFHLTWTDGRDGVDQRSSTYNATECVDPVEPPELTANVTCEYIDEVSLFTLHINQSNSTPATFDPADGTNLPNGDPVTVTATYLDEHQEEQTVTTETASVDDCTPPEVDKPEFSAYLTCEVEGTKAVYRLHIKQSNVTAATYDPADGTVLDSGDPIDVTATYVDKDQKEQTVTATAEGVADCSPKVLPNTGAGLGIAGFFGISGLAASVRGWKKSRQDLLEA